MFYQTVIQNHHWLSSVEVVIIRFIHSLGNAKLDTKLMPSAYLSLDGWRLHQSREYASWGEGFRKESMPHISLKRRPDPDLANVTSAWKISINEAYLSENVLQVA